MRALAKGLLAGLFFSILFIGGNQITGFAIYTGPQTINLQQQISENTLIPLSTPERLSSMQLTGRYEGSGSVEVILISQEQSLELASFQAPQEEQVLVLGGNGSVNQTSQITVTEIFDEFCDQTCEINTTGPYLLQVRVQAGTFTLSSVTYTTPQTIAREQQPEAPEPQEEQLAPEATSNAACSENSDCSGEEQCLLSQCVHQENYLTITNDDSETIMIIDHDGDILLRSSLNEQESGSSSQQDFRITSQQDTISWVTSQGSLHILGVVSENQNQLPLSEESVIIEGENSPIVEFSQEGNLFTVGEVVEFALN